MRRRKIASVFFLILLCGLACWAVLPATDTFTGTNNNALSANWTINGTSSHKFNIQSNQACIASAGNTILEHWNADSFGADQYSKGNISLSGTSGNFVGLAVRAAASAETAYVFHCAGPPGSPNACQIYKGVAAAYTAYGAAFNSQNSGDLLQIQVTGSSNPVTITVTNITTGGTVLRTVPDDCSAHGACLTSGSAGIAGFGSDTGDCVDNWEGGNVASAALGGVNKRQKLEALDQ